MPTIQYIATAKDSRLLELPEEAQALGIKPGERISIQADRQTEGNGTPEPVVPNEKLLDTLREIARMQEGRRHTDGSETDRFIREGRAGGMYGDESSAVVIDANVPVAIVSRETGRDAKDSTELINTARSTALYAPAVTVHLLT